MLRFNLNTSNDIGANTVHLIEGNELSNMLDIFLLKMAASDIVGIPPDPLNASQEIADAINNDPNLFSNDK